MQSGWLVSVYHARHQFMGKELLIILSYLLRTPEVHLYKKMVNSNKVTVKNARNFRAQIRVRQFARFRGEGCFARVSSYEEKESFEFSGR